MKSTEPHYVILRDDDTNALTPVACLERLYRPFLNAGLPVNLATIPEVRTDAVCPNGKREGFLPKANPDTPDTLPLGENRELVRYLQSNRGYRVVHHGCHHDCCEFESTDRREIRRRLDLGAQRFAEAGFDPPTTFVAPHDRFSRASLEETARRFRVVSSGWFECRRLPISWWPRYSAARFMRAPHWQMGSTRLLSHPGCLLSRFRPFGSMLDRVKEAVQARRLTVLVTHWWEYFPEGKPHDEFIAVLHATAAYLRGRSDIKVVSFEELAEGRVPLR